MNQSQREQEIADEIAQLVRIQAIAEKAKKTGDATKAVERIGKLRSESIRLQRSREIDAMTDEVEKLNALSKLAMDEGSWIAAEKFSSDAIHLSIERQRLELERAALEFTNMSEAEICDAILGLIPDLGIDFHLKLKRTLEQCQY